MVFLEKYLKGFEILGCICIESKDLRACLFCAELGFFILLNLYGEKC